ncbi:MAG: hypothetical protein ABIV94_00105 [Acidimicrobiales bacterium]
MTGPELVAYPRLRGALARATAATLAELTAAPAAPTTTTKEQTR